MQQPAIEYRDVTVTTPSGATILGDVSIAIGRGERVAFLGRSGAGKTTALKVINGLIAPSRGSLLVDGAAVPAHEMPRLRRRIGFVMQHPALFPHRSVHDNIATVPRLLGWDESRTRSEAASLLDQLELGGDLAERHPRTLSGGQQQRVAIARALIASPEILLCDEPFSALDPLIRAELLSLLERLTSERGTTLVFVTHDVAEALRIAKRIVLFDAGRIAVETTSEQFAAHPHPLVQKFVEASR